MSSFKKEIMIRTRVRVQCETLHFSDLIGALAKTLRWVIPSSFYRCDSWNLEVEQMTLPGSSSQ